MAKIVSAGILLYKYDLRRTLNFFLAHPGGPYWAKRDDFSWSIPKGLVEDCDENLEAVARREFQEETGHLITEPIRALGAFKQSSGKVVHAFVAQQDVDHSNIKSNEFELEWPPKSGVIRKFPEIDRAAWFDYPTAKKKILKGQAPMLDALLNLLVHDRPVDRPG